MPLIKGETSTYKTWVGLLTQSGTSAPTAIVLENTLGGTITWTYVSLGVYRATLTGAFTANKTFAIGLTGTDNTVPFIGYITRENNNSLLISNTSPQGDNGDNDLAATPLEIRVYL